MEQLAAEAAELEKAKTEIKAISHSVEVPETEISVKSLTPGQRLISLLLTCGATPLDIALELGLTAEYVARFENNRLIQEQITLYKERFFSSDPQAQLKEMLPDSIRYLRQVLDDDTIIDSRQKLDTIKWIIEKVTGKAKQQIDVGDSLGFGHLLDEMKKMREVREAIASGAQHSPANSYSLIDVTPAPGASNDASQKDKYEKWLDELDAGKA